MNLAFLNKKAVAYNMSQGDVTLLKLLENFSTKELRILAEHPDLRERARKIASMGLSELEAMLEEEYSLKIDRYAHGEVLISVEDLIEAIPDWFSTEHAGWYLTLAEFEPWAKNFLLQEVRINAWIRYLEHKAKNPQTSSGYGLYL